MSENEISVQNKFLYKNQYDLHLYRTQLYVSKVEKKAYLIRCHRYIARVCIRNEIKNGKKRLKVFK